MINTENNNSSPEENLPPKQLLLCDKVILKGVGSNVLHSKIGKFIFAPIYDPVSDSLGDCLIDLETDYTLGLVNALIGETLKVDPGSSYLRLRAPEFQTSEVQELINSYLANSVNESAAVINSRPAQEDEYLENLIMTIAEQCNAKEIPAAIAILFPKKKN